MCSDTWAGRCRRSRGRRRRPARNARFLHLAVARPVLMEEADQVVLALPRRREAKLELGHGRPRDPARLELDQGPLPGRVLQQDVMEVLGSEQVQPRDGPFELTLTAGTR